MKYALGNMLNGAGGLNPDGLSLDLQFAADKTLTARKGPTPVFTRSSGDNGGTTYFGPSSINAIFTHSGDDFNVNTTQLTLASGRYSWQDGDTALFYNGSRWILNQDGETVATSALAANAWRPDDADWSGTGAVVTATGEFGIVRAANNEPRFDHDPITLACRGLLIEESRTNQIIQSEDLGTSWSTDSGRVAVAANVIASPSGATNADKITENNTLIDRRILISTVTAVASTVYTYSCFLKAGERDVAQLAFGGTFGNQYQNFIIGGVNAGALGSGSGITSPQIIAFPNGWYRCTVTITSAGAGSTQVTIGPADSSTLGKWGAYLGTVGSGIYAWGAQLEAGSFPTSYIPTTTASVIRSADVCSITGSAFSGFYNPLEGSLACDYAITTGFTGNRYAASIEDTAGGTQNGFILRNTNSAASFIAGSGYTSIIGSVTTGVSKHILAYSGLTEFVYVKDGVVGTVTGSGTRDPSLPIRMSIGSLEGGFVVCGHISSLRYFKKRLPNTKLQALTV